MSALADTPSILLTKAQLAQHYGRSERWVELRVQEGMPSIPPSRRYACRRFVLSEVDEWLNAEREENGGSIERQVADLRRQVSELRDRVEQLEERTG